MKVLLSGLDTFTDDLANTRVIFGRVFSEELQQFANDLNNHFCETEWISEKNKKETVKMHFTLLKSSNLERQSGPNHMRSNFHFDSTAIFKVRSH